MFTPLATDARTAATQLVSALDRYDQDLSVLVARGYQPELYSRMSRRFDEMRGFAAALPKLSVSWVTLLISRVDLTHSLFLAHNGDASGVEGQFTAHTVAVATLRKECRQLLRG
jgi:hypothetical protein